MMKPLGSEATVAGGEFADYGAQKHGDRSDTHSIQQMAAAYIH